MKTLWISDELANEIITSWLRSKGKATESECVSDINPQKNSHTGGAGFLISIEDHFAEGFIAAAGEMPT